MVDKISGSIVNHNGGLVRDEASSNCNITLYTNYTREIDLVNVLNDFHLALQKTNLNVTLTVINKSRSL